LVPVSSRLGATTPNAVHTYVVPLSLRLTLSDWIIKRVIRAETSLMERQHPTLIETAKRKATYEER